MSQPILYREWRDGLTTDQVEDYLFEIYLEEMAHRADIEADAEIQEELDRRAN